MSFIRCGSAVSFYEVRPAASATPSPALVLIHALGTSHRIWDGVLAALRFPGPVLRYDLPGHGLSEVGECPYTFAKDRAQLTEVIERAVTDPQWRADEAKRVGQYVVAYHDYASVARRYEHIIANATGWTNVATPTKKRGKNVAA